MPAPNAFDYAIIRVVPRVERDEFINAGVIVHCPTRDFLEARVWLDEARLKALFPAIDVADVRAHLEVFPRIAAGDETAGPIAQLPRSQRFHWLVAPRSTMLQTSPVHAGMAHTPDDVLGQLMTSFVLPAL
ncbi:MAG: DUF3037 domain-containing protein [Archangium sp.]|nr:DUF3037 domain-containing protein [Archangium sp.]